MDLPQGVSYGITFEHENTPRPWASLIGTIVPNSKGEYFIPSCSANLIQSDHYLYLQLYALYKDGFLLHEGGISDQPARYIQAMRIIDSEVNRVQRREMEKKQKKNRGR